MKRPFITRLVASLLVPCQLAANPCGSRAAAHRSPLPPSGYASSRISSEALAAAASNYFHRNGLNDHAAFFELRLAQAHPSALLPSLRPLAPPSAEDLAIVHSLTEEHRDWFWQTIHAIQAYADGSIQDRSEIFTPLARASSAAVLLSRYIELFGADALGIHFEFARSLRSEAASDLEPELKARMMRSAEELLGAIVGEDAVHPEFTENIRRAFDDNTFSMRWLTAGTWLIRQVGNVWKTGDPRAPSMRHVGDQLEHLLYDMATNSEIYFALPPDMLPGLLAFHIMIATDHSPRQQLASFVHGAVHVLLEAFVEEYRHLTGANGAGRKDRIATAGQTLFLSKSGTLREPGQSLTADGDIFVAEASVYEKIRALAREAPEIVTESSIEAVVERHVTAHTPALRAWKRFYLEGAALGGLAEGLIQTSDFFAPAFRAVTTSSTVSLGKNLNLMIGALKKQLGVPQAVVSDPAPEEAQEAFEALCPRFEALLARRETLFGELRTPPMSQNAPWYDQVTALTRYGLRMALWVKEEPTIASLRRFRAPAVEERDKAPFSSVVAAKSEMKTTNRLREAGLSLQDIPADGQTLARMGLDAETIARKERYWLDAELFDSGVVSLFTLLRRSPAEKRRQNLTRLEDILTLLQTGPGSSGMRFVETIATASAFSFSGVTQDEAGLVQRTRELLELFESPDPNVPNPVALIQAHELGRHFRLVISMDSEPALAHYFEFVYNAVDYSLAKLALIPLWQTFDRYQRGVRLASGVAEELLLALKDIYTGVTRSLVDGKFLIENSNSVDGRKEFERFQPEGDPGAIFYPAQLPAKEWVRYETLVHRFRPGLGRALEKNAALPAPSNDVYSPEEQIRPFPQWTLQDLVVSLSELPPEKVSRFSYETLNRVSRDPETIALIRSAYFPLPELEPRRFDEEIRTQLSRIKKYAADRVRTLMDKSPRNYDASPIRLRDSP